VGAESPAAGALGRWRIAAAWAAHLGAVALIGLVDYVTGPDIELGAVYLLPLLSAAYSWGRALSVAVAVLSAASWYFNTDLDRPEATANIGVFAWNGLSRVAIYVVLALVVDQLRQRHAEVQRLATTDDLTGLPNARRFQTDLRAELARADRHGRTLALFLIDCDDLKRVNDEFGHTDGNRVPVSYTHLTLPTICSV